jgi:hypothetical protein
MPDGSAHTSREKLEVFQKDAKDLNVTVDNFPPQDVFQNLPHYQALAHNVAAVVWTPASGNKIHLVSFVVSTTQAGYVILRERTPPATDADFIRLEFGSRQAVPFGLNTDLDFAKGHLLVALWVSDAPPGTAYITAIGHEHAVP